METEEILWIAAKAWGTPTLWNLDQLIHSFLTEKRDHFDIQGIPIDKKMKLPAAAYSAEAAASAAKAGSYGVFGEGE